MLAEAALASPALFAHLPAEGAGTEVGDDERKQAFINRTVAVMEEHGKPGNLAAERGIPFCCMDKSRIYTGRHSVYDLSKTNQLDSLVNNIGEFVEML